MVLSARILALDGLIGTVPPRLAIHVTRGYLETRVYLPNLNNQGNLYFHTRRHIGWSYHNFVLQDAGELASAYLFILVVSISSRQSSTIQSWNSVFTNIRMLDPTLVTQVSENPQQWYLPDACFQRVTLPDQQMGLKIFLQGARAPYGPVSSKMPSCIDHFQGSNSWTEKNTLIPSDLSVFLSSVRTWGVPELCSPVRQRERAESLQWYGRNPGKIHSRPAVHGDSWRIPLTSY